MWVPGSGAAVGPQAPGCPQGLLGCLSAQVGFSLLGPLAQLWAADVLQVLAPGRWLASCCLVLRAAPALSALAPTCMISFPTALSDLTSSPTASFTTFYKDWLLVTPCA